MPVRVALGALFSSSHKHTREFALNGALINQVCLLSSFGKCVYARAFYANCVRCDTKYKAPKQRKECHKGDILLAAIWELLFLRAPESAAPHRRARQGEIKKTLGLILSDFIFFARAATRDL